MAGASITSYRLKNGGDRWRLQFYYRDWRGKLIKKKKEGFRLKRDALAWYHDFIEKKAPTASMTFAKLCRVYMDSLEGVDAVTTLSNRLNTLQVSVLPFIGDIPINAIDVQTIETYLDELARRGNLKTGRPLAKSTLAGIRSLVGAVFNFGIQRGYITTNPVKGSRVKVRLKQVDPKEIWTVDEFNRLLRWFDGRPEYYRYKLALMVLFWTGCRAGECLALTPGDFDFENCEVSITKNRQNLKGHVGGIIKTPKTKTSVRTVPVPPKVCRAVAHYVEMTTGMTAETLLFPFERTTLGRRMDIAAKEVGLHRVTLHGLRHSYASMLINRGVSLEVVKTLLGHAAIGVTANIYSHVYKESLSKVALDLDSDVQT